MTKRASNGLSAILAKAPEVDGIGASIDLTVETHSSTVEQVNGGMRHREDDTQAPLKNSIIKQPSSTSSFSISPSASVSESDDFEGSPN